MGLSYAAGYALDYLHGGDGSGEDREDQDEAIEPVVKKKKKKVLNRAQPKGSEFIYDDFGRIYHLQVSHGCIANRIIIAGSLERAAMIAWQNFENVTHFKIHRTGSNGYFQFKSNREILIITGLYNSKKRKMVPITIIGTGIGFPLTDLCLREAREIVDGEIACVRIGTCGLLREDVGLGGVFVADECIGIRRNPDAFCAPAKKNQKTTKKRKYTCTNPIPASKQLTRLLQTELIKVIGRKNIRSGMNASACSFYSSQGRIGMGLFRDYNKSVISDARKRYSRLATMEMETFHLFDLGRCSVLPFHFGGVHIPLAARGRDQFLEKEKQKKLEGQVGKAVLEALALVGMKDTMGKKNGIWDEQFFNRTTKEVLEPVDRVEMEKQQQ